MALHRRDGLRLPEVPVLDRLIPGSRYQQRLRRIARVGDHLAAADGGIVGGYLLRGGGACADIQHTRSFVCAGSDDFCTILETKRQILSKTYFAT